MLRFIPKDFRFCKFGFAKISPVIENKIAFFEKLSIKASKDLLKKDRKDAGALKVKKEIFRIKINLTMRTEKLFNHVYHIDLPNKCTTAIFYVNSNNGKTIFKQGDEVDSVANRMVVFNSDLEHAATSHTDEKTRVVINFNYL